MAALEAAVRSIEKPGLLWGLSKLVPIGFGIKKLQMSVVVEDELVSVDELQEQIAEFEDYVQVRVVPPFLSSGFPSIWPPLTPLLPRPAVVGCRRHGQALSASSATPKYHLVVDKYRPPKETGLERGCQRKNLEVVTTLSCCPRSHC